MRAIPCVAIFTWPLLITQAQNAAPAPIFPKALAAGDTIMFVAPAKYLNKDRVTLAKKRLEKLGFKVKLPDYLFRKRGFLAGSDNLRALELMAAFADPEVNAIFPGTGGYGSTRIVDKLDYDVIRRNPKIFVGFSDITGLHIAINQRTGLVTFHSPNPEWGLGSEDGLAPFAAKWFWRALLKTEYDDPKLPSLVAAGDLPLRDGRGRGRVGYTIETHAADDSQLSDPWIFKGVPRPETLANGRARGRLIGGNLSVLHALMGTPYEIETDGKILFLEDIGEAPYRVDRMLSTLRLAGKFDKVNGVILGAFTARKEEAKWDEDASIDDVLRDYFADLGVPVLAHFPVGHVRYNATLPVGAQMELDADRQTLKVLENPVRAR